MILYWEFLIGWDVGFAIYDCVLMFARHLKWEIFPALFMVGITVLPARMIRRARSQPK